MAEERELVESGVALDEDLITEEDRATEMLVVPANDENIYSDGHFGSNRRSRGAAEDLIVEEERVTEAQNIYVDGHLGSNLFRSALAGLARIPLAGLALIALAFVPKKADCSPFVPSNPEVAARRPSEVHRIDVHPSTEEYHSVPECPDLHMQPTQGHVDDEIHEIDVHPSTEEYHSAPECPDLYMQATQGHVNGFRKILQSISSEKEPLTSKILCHVGPWNNTYLHIAARFGHHDLAKYIVGACPDLIKMENSNGDTALHIAARKKDLSFVKIVMDSDVEKAEPSLLTIVNKQENTVLHEALIHDCKQEEVVEILIKADPQVAYYPNKEGKSPLYIAAEANYFHVVEAIGKYKVEGHMKNRYPEAKPAVHGAILGKNKEMLEKILAMKLVHQKDKDGRTPLHCAASIGYLEGVKTLLGQHNLDRYQRDKKGFYPIHIASMRGFVGIVKELLRHSPHSHLLLSEYEGKNFLHVAASCGHDNIVNFVLKKRGLESLINDKDNNGNTPLHLATMDGRAKVVNYLTRDKRVDVNLLNDEGQAAYHIAVSVEHPSFHQRLIWMALKSAAARPAGNSKVPPSTRSKSINMEEYKDRLNTLLLVSTLVATVTFAAGFTMPGGYNSSDPNAGMATLLMTNTFHMFVICNTIAMYTSIVAAITLIWAQLDDLNLMLTALRWALPLLGLALTAMSLAFMAGVYLVVSSLHWLATVVLIIGIICIVGLLVPILLLLLPLESTNCILRYVFYYPFLVLAWASKSPEIKLED